MASSTRLTASVVRKTCRPEEIPFATSAAAPCVQAVMVGQDRALEALRFGTGMHRAGYNLFAVGRAGVGKQTMLRAFLAQRTAGESARRDLCYVYDFAHPETPRALELPAGSGARLQRDMVQAVLELRSALRAAFDGEAYGTRRQRLREQFGRREDDAIAQVRTRAAQHDVAVQRSSSGLEIAPIYDGSAIDLDAFRKLPESEQQRLCSKCWSTSKRPWSVGRRRRQHTRACWLR